MAPVAAAIKRHGLVFLDARSISGTVAAKTVTTAGGRALSNDLFIDADPRPGAISAALERLAKQARSRAKAAESVTIVDIEDSTLGEELRIGTGDKVIGGLFAAPGDAAKNDASLAGVDCFFRYRTKRQRAAAGRRG